MPRQPHVAGLSGGRRVVVVESDGSSFTQVLARTDGVGWGGGVADTRLVSKIGKGERSTGAVSSRLFVATAETCAGGYFADGIAVGMMIQMLVAS